MIAGMKRIIFSLLLLVSTAQAQGSRLYSLTTTDSTLLLRWVESGSQISGALQVVSVGSGQDSNVNITNATIQGTHNGQNYSFIVDKKINLLGGAAWDGTLIGNTLKVQIPLENGGFGELTLQQTTIEKFNTSVAKIKILGEQKAKTVTANKNLQAAAKMLNSQYQTILQLSTDLTSDTPRLIYNISSGQKQLSDLQTRNINLKSLANQKRCDDFKKAFDIDLDARRGFASTANILSDQIEKISKSNNSLSIAVSLYDNSLLQYRQNGGDSSLLPRDAELLKQAKQQVNNLNSQLSSAENLLTSMHNAEQRLLQENDSLTCK